MAPAVKYQQTPFIINNSTTSNSFSTSDISMEQAERCHSLPTSSGSSTNPTGTISTNTVRKESKNQKSKEKKKGLSHNIPFRSPPATVVGDDIEKLYLERAGVCKLTAADYKRLVVHCRHSPYDEYIGR